MLKKGFEGWYFKHQKDGETVAFIPGRARGGPFIQMIDKSGSRHFDVNILTVEGDIIRAGGCIFSSRGAVIDLPSVKGEIRYGPFTPLRSHIMGPFRFLPLECSHGVISMGHDLSGKLLIEGRGVDFDGGRGYVETDSGTSFPRSYLWLQCNGFLAPCSIMVSIAHIPFLAASFTGCICAIVYEGREYRLATYNGVRIKSAGPRHICLRRGSLTFTADVEPGSEGHSLRSPVKGRMSGIIRENNDAAVRCRLTEGGRVIFDLESRHAGFEYVQ